MDYSFAREFCGNFSRFHTDPWIKRYIFPNSVLPSLASLARAAEGFLILEDVSNIGPNYDPTLVAWEENFRRAWHVSLRPQSEPLRGVIPA